MWVESVGVGEVLGCGVSVGLWFDMILGLGWGVDSCILGSRKHLGEEGRRFSNIIYVKPANP